MPHLETEFQEADLDIPLHVLDCLKNGYDKVLVVTNDTDITVELLYYVPQFNQHGMNQLWIMAGRGRTTRYIPLHLLYTRMASGLCSVLPALYILTGSDAVSKIGTKKAALEAKPEALLKDFGQSPFLSDSMIQKAEEFLVKVLKHSSTSTTFTSLRKEQYHASTSATHLTLPPTSHGLLAHIQRSHYNTYIITHLMTPGSAVISPQEFGYTLNNGQLVPSMSWKLVEAKYTVTCKCVKCARVGCPCRIQEVKCVQFCGCKALPDCKNQNV